MSDRAEAAVATTRRFSEAVEAGDVDAALATLAPDVIAHSPVTASGHFHGHNDLRDVLTAMSESMADIRYTSDIGDNRIRHLSGTARIGRQPLEESMRIELDDQARIREITVFVRPLAGAAAFLDAVGPRLARRHGRARATAFYALSKPLLAVTRTGDKLGIRLAGLRRD
jgi:hypothetical protein